MNGKHYIGKRVSHIEKYDETAPISGVALLLDENNEILAGDQNGFVLDITCPYGTQEMANDILAKLQGHTYKGFRADNAPLDIGAELGDGVTVDGLYSVLAYRSVRFGPGHFSEIAAPGENELQHEYNYLSPTEKLQRKIATTNSRITKTAKEIMLEVANEIEGLSSSITVKLDSITSRVEGAEGNITTLTQTANGLETKVQGLNGKYSTLEQKVDSFKLSVNNGSTSSTISLTANNATISSQTITMNGLVTFTGLSNGTTTIDGACIKTGTIDANRLNLTGSISFNDMDNNTYNAINGAVNKANAASNNVRALADGNYSGTFIDGHAIYSPEIYAQYFYVYAEDSDGGFYLMGRYNSRRYAMFAIDYQIGEVPYVNIYSPARAFIDIGNEYANIAFYGNVDFSAANVTGL